MGEQEITDFLNNPSKIVELSSSDANFDKLISEYNNDGGLVRKVDGKEMPISQETVQALTEYAGKGGSLVDPNKVEFIDSFVNPEGESYLLSQDDWTELVDKIYEFTQQGMQLNDKYL